jgi:hypothetical protein
MLHYVPRSLTPPAVPFSVLISSLYLCADKLLDMHSGSSNDTLGLSNSLDSRCAGICISICHDSYQQIRTSYVTVGNAGDSPLIVVRKVFEQGFRLHEQYKVVLFIQ